VEGDEIEEGKASLVASPPRYPQVGKTVEGDEIAKRQRITGRVVPRYLWEGKTMEGTGRLRYYKGSQAFQRLKCATFSN